MKTLISKEQFKVLTKECNALEDQICKFENENDIPKDLLKKYSELSDILIDYENAYHPLPWKVSTLITDEIKTQMEKKQLKQVGLGKLLGIDKSRVSELINGKRPLNLNIVKKLHTELNIPADFLLAHS
ncbi:MAG: helix-turn-helix domain-containing protein [Bacteroidales bacterium]|nr:helix-turn-helix domain-containing protein [Bacteroidales bacterium]